MLLFDLRDGFQIVVHRMFLMATGSAHHAVVEFVGEAD